MMRRLPLIIGIFILGGLISALPISGVDARAEEIDDFEIARNEAIKAKKRISVTIQTDVELTLDKSDLANPVFSGTGDIYAKTLDAYSHRFVRVKLPDDFTMGTPKGERTAPSGTKAIYRGSMNARNGFENYKAINGIDGKSDTDIYMGQIEVSVPMTDDFYELGPGRYSISIPVTLEIYEDYGAYSKNLDFKAWDEMIEDNEIILISDGMGGTELQSISRDDMILDIDPSISTLAALFGELSYREIVFPTSLKWAQAYNNEIMPFANSNVRKVIFENGTTEIPWQIMKDCDTLEEAVLPSTVTSFSADCFKNCTSLDKISIPPGAKFGNNCFSFCESLKELHITEGISTEATFRKWAPFYGSGLRKIIVDEGVTSIPDFICAGCMDVTEIYLPESLETVGNECFTDMPMLREITVRSDIRRLQKNSTSGCFENTELERIIFKEGVTIVAERMFSNGCEHTAMINFPESLVSIGDGAFYNCTYLQEIFLHDSVTYIGSDAFSGCEMVNNIILPEANTLLGSSCFKGAKALRDISVCGDYRMDVLGSTRHPFSGAGLESIIVSYGVKEIPEDMFAGGCSKVTKLILPNTLSKIGTRAFWGCRALKKVVIKSDVDVQSEASPFLDGGVERFVFEDGVTKINTNLFTKAYKQLREIYIPKSVKKITSIALVDNPVTYTIFYGGTREEWELIRSYAYMNPKNIIYSYHSSSAKGNILSDDEKMDDQGEEALFGEENMTEITDDSGTADTMGDENQTEISDDEAAEEELDDTEMEELEEVIDDTEMEELEEVIDDTETEELEEAAIDVIETKEFEEAGNETEKGAST